MNLATRKFRSPLKWHGGKSYLARRIISLMPMHQKYAELFLGGGSVLLNKFPCSGEICGDVNTGLIRFWRVLRDSPDTLSQFLKTITYSKESFDWAYAFDVEPFSDRSDDVIPSVAAFLIRNRFSRGGLGKDFAWSDRLRGKNRPDGPVPGDINAWDTIREDLPRIAERIKDVSFVHADYADCLDGLDHDENALVYLDPPYMLATRTAKAAYAFEMTKSGDQVSDHLNHSVLLDRINQAQCSIILSGYDSPLYADRLRPDEGWSKLMFDMPNHSGQGKAKQRRVECVWVRLSGRHVKVKQANFVGYTP